MKSAYFLATLTVLALLAPKPRLPHATAEAIRADEDLGPRVAALEASGDELESLPLYPLESLQVGSEGITCRRLLPNDPMSTTCLGKDRIYVALKAIALNLPVPPFSRAAP